jgi:hypothetical protein
MFLFIRAAFFWLVVLLFFGCKKEKVIKNEDNFIEQTEQLSELKAEVSAAGYQFVEVQWNAVNNSHFKAVNYSIYLDDQKIIDGLTATKYSLINLKAGKAYSIKIIASTKDGRRVEQIVKTSTLSSPVDGSGQSIYQEYSIHSYSSMMGPTGLQKLKDGGHLIARTLQHPNYFGDGSFKIIVFRTDKSGLMLWYRLLSAKAFRDITTGEMFLTSHNGDQEGLLFMQNYAVKFAINNGEILLEKRYEDDLKGQVFKSVFYVSSQQIIAGTDQGTLLSVNPEDLSVTWHQANANRSGTIVAINVDSKKNIYYIFRDRNDRYTNIRVHKCNANGEFLKDFLFDGALPNENNWGFRMTSLLVDEQDNLYLFGRNSDYNYLRYFKFNTDGTILKKNQQSDNLSAEKSFFNEKGEIVVVGQIDGGGLNTYAGIYVFDKDMNIKSKLFYTNIPPHIVRGITGNPDGSYNIFLNYMQTYTYENSNFVFIKTDANGKA